MSDDMAFTWLLSSGTFYRSCSKHFFCATIWCSKTTCVLRVIQNYTLSQSMQECCRASYLLPYAVAAPVGQREQCPLSAQIFTTIMHLWHLTFKSFFFKFSLALLRTFCFNIWLFSLFIQRKFSFFAQYTFHTHASQNAWKWNQFL